MTRIVGGRWGGRRLVVPRSGVRPTSERVREAVANRLDHLCGGVAGLRVLDLYAGSGAVGLELLSRGAGGAVFVERDRAALAALRRNIASLHADGARVLARDAAAAARSHSGRAGDRGHSRVPEQACDPEEACDIVFADPPYDVGLHRIREVLADVVASGWAAPGAVVVVETAVRSAGSPWPAAVEPLDSRDYGDTRVWYGQVSVAS